MRVRVPQGALSSGTLTSVFINPHDIQFLWTDPSTYNFFSSVFGELVIKIPLAIWFLHHFECNVTGCHKVGHKVSGTSFRACKKHHPKLKYKEETTAEEIAEAHKRSNVLPDD